MARSRAHTTPRFRERNLSFLYSVVSISPKPCESSREIFFILQIQRLNLRALKRLSQGYFPRPCRGGRWDSHPGSSDSKVARGWGERPVRTGGAWSLQSPARESAGGLSSPAPEPVVQRPPPIAGADWRPPPSHVVRRLGAPGAWGERSGRPAGRRRRERALQPAASGPWPPLSAHHSLGPCAQGARWRRTRRRHGAGALCPC